MQIKETYKKIKASSEKYLNPNETKITKDNYNNSINKNMNSNKESSNKHLENVKLNNFQSFKSFEKENTNKLNESIETYHGSFNEDIDNLQNPYANLLNIREERIKILTEKNNEKEIKINILNQEKKALIKAVEDLIEKFNPPKHASLIKNDSQ